MDNFLDILYEMQNQSIASDKINTDSKTAELLDQKDKLESSFANILLNGQEIPFDNFMDSLDKCNDDLRRIAFKNGFTLAFTLIKDAMKYSQNKSDNPIIKFIEGMQQIVLYIRMVRKLAILFIWKKVIEIFDWLGDIVSGLGDAIGNAFDGISDKLIDGILNRIIQWIFTVIYDGIAEFFTMISGLGVEIFSLDWVNAVVKLFSLFGWTLFVVGLVVSAFDLAIEYQNGRASIHGTAINWIKGFMAVSLFTVTPIELYKFCVTLQNTLSGDLTRIFASQQGTTLGEVALYVLKIGFYKDGAIIQAGLFELIALIALGYCVVKIFFDNIKRGGILLIQIAVGSLYMFSIPRGYGDGFTQWMKQIIALCLTAFLQTTLLFLGLLTWTDNMLLAIGIMMAASEVPRIAERFGLDTSVKFNMMSAVHMTSTAVNLVKSVAKQVKI